MKLLDNVREHSLAVLCCAIVIVLLAWLGYRHQRLVELPVAVPEDVGPLWQECPVAAPYSWGQVEDCFGHPMPLSREDEQARWGQRVGGEGWRLTIGADTYQTGVSITFLPARSLYSLYRNGVRQASLWGGFVARSPDISLQNAGGKVAWEFADYRVDTIIYDGQDLRRVYALTAAYRPYALGDRLIFLAKRGDTYFVVYDGRRIGPEFDEVAIAYCCEPLLWSVQGGQGRYLFWGSRDGPSYVVEVTQPLKSRSQCPRSCQAD